MAGETTGRVFVKKSLLGLRPWQLTIVALLLGGVAVNTWMQLADSAPRATDIPVQSTPVVTTITALGHLEPAGEVVAVSAMTTAEGGRIEALLIKEGDWVEPGQAIALLDSRDRLEATLFEAEERVGVAKANLARIMAGSSNGEITAQQATIARVNAERQTAIQAQNASIARLKLELANADQDAQRYERLYQEGAISEAERDRRQLTRDVVAQQLSEAEAQLAQTQSTLEEQLKAERATLDRIAEVRPVDIAVAEAEVRQAEAAVKRARADFDQTVITSPQAGRVLEVYTRPGETIAPEGVVAIGQTDRMYAVAEIYDTDVAKIAVGQTARVTSPSFSEPLQGHVERIGWQVQRQRAIDADPAANLDERIVNVWVKLDDAASQQIQQLTNLQVTVEISRL